jgi:Ca2+-binding EF-hand superfamily protein
MPAGAGTTPIDTIHTTTEDMMNQNAKRTSKGKGMKDNKPSHDECTVTSRAIGRFGFGRIVLVAATLVLAPAVGLARSEMAPGGGQGFVDRFGRNGDGSVSREEFPGPAEHFGELDTDGDGFIDAGEAPEGPVRGGRGGFERDDRDEDGRISRDEFSGASDHFDELDENQDGYIDRGEGHRAGPGRGGFERDDRDEDGRVSRDEFSGPWDDFDGLDENRDGYIDRDEAHRAGRAEGCGGGRGRRN